MAAHGAVLTRVHTCKNMAGPAPSKGPSHCTHMQAAGVHAVQHVPHTLEDAPHPQRPADVHPAGVDHHPQRGCTAKLRYELPHTVLHLWARQVTQQTVSVLLLHLVHCSLFSRSIVSGDRIHMYRHAQGRCQPVQSRWCRPAPAQVQQRTLPPTPSESIEPKRVAGVPSLHSE